MSFVVPGVTHCEKCWARIDINKGKTCMCDTEKKIFVDERKENKMGIQKLPMTNGDYIRQMDDGELAWYLTNVVPYNLFFTQNNQEEAEKWLKQECKIKANKDNTSSEQQNPFKYDFGDVVKTRDGRGVIVFRCTKIYLTTLEEENRYLVYLERAGAKKEYGENEITPEIRGDED